MNLFATFPCPIQSARFLDQKRKIKMTLESMQLLCTAINLNGGTSPYKTTHKNHPVAVWARQTKANYKWVLRHFIALCREYTKTTGKIHKCQTYIKQLYNGVRYIPEGSLTPHVNCAANSEFGVSFHHITDVHEAYQKYLCWRFQHDKRPAFSNLGVKNG